MLFENVQRSPSLARHNLLGSHVLLQDLVQRPELNGRLGEVEKLHVTEDGSERAIVRLDGDGLQVSIKKVCLRRANRWAPTPWSTAQQRKDFFEKWRREISRNKMGTPWRAVV